MYLVKEANGGAGVNVILDPVGGSYANQNMEVLERDGRWVVYACMGTSHSCVTNLYVYDTVVHVDTQVVKLFTMTCFWAR